MSYTYRCDICGGTYGGSRGFGLCPSCTREEEFKKIEKQERKKEKEIEKQERKKERKQQEKQSSNSSNNSSNSGGGNSSSAPSRQSSATPEEAMVAAAALVELFTASSKAHKAKVAELKSMPIPSNPKDLKKSFMFLISQCSPQEFPINMRALQAPAVTREVELITAIVDKLDSFLKYWKLESSSEEDYDRVKIMFEEEFGAAKKKLEDFKEKNAKARKGLLIVMVLMFIFMALSSM